MIHACGRVVVWSYGWLLVKLGYISNLGEKVDIGEKVDMDGDTRSRVVAGRTRIDIRGIVNNHGARTTRGSE